MFVNSEAIYLNDEDIINHVVVPKHEILDSKAVKEVLDKYNISVGDLPRILKDDPAIRMFGAKTDDVVKISRKSATSGVSVYYRVVV